MKKKKDEVSFRSSAVEYLTYVATFGDQHDSFEIRYEDENIWLTQKMVAAIYKFIQIQNLRKIQLSGISG